MNTSSLKNMVVLKDLPSNIIEEAIIVLKENQKIPKLEVADKENKRNKIIGQDEKMKQKRIENKKEEKSQTNSKDYIIKEAQMLIAEYISKIENRNKKENKSIQTLKIKYKKVKTLNYILAICLIRFSHYTVYNIKLECIKHHFQTYTWRKKTTKEEVYFCGKNNVSRRKNKKSRRNIL